MRCGIEVQNGMVERNAGLPPERRIEFRVGIHLGDVVEESDGDLMGDGVNIAARLEGIADPHSFFNAERSCAVRRSSSDFASSRVRASMLSKARVNECVTAFVIVPSFAPTGATTEIAASDKPSARDHLTLRIDDGSAGARPCACSPR